MAQIHDSKIKQNLENDQNASAMQLNKIKMDSCGNNKKQNRQQNNAKQTQIIIE